MLTDFQKVLLIVAAGHMLEDNQKELAAVRAKFDTKRLEEDFLPILLNMSEEKIIASIAEAMEDAFSEYVTVEENA